ncbi:hypothetical protein B0H13DRAFT_1925031, partial [Mycena leptocephala]
PPLVQTALTAGDPSPHTSSNEPNPPRYILPPGRPSTSGPPSPMLLPSVRLFCRRRTTVSHFVTYRWIAIVYPHFKLGETTWMNSIRHVVNTTTHFRKVRIQNAAAKFHWAILDEDLGSFVNGGYQP